MLEARKGIDECNGLEKRKINETKCKVEVKPVKVYRLTKDSLPGCGLGEVGGARARKGHGDVVEINGRL